MFSGEEDSANPMGVTSQSSLKSQEKIYNSGSLRDQREARREKFLVEFNSSQVYSNLRLKLKKAIFRLAVEKYNKQVDHRGLTTKQQKEQFKAELYSFLQEQMKVFLNKAIERVIENSQNFEIKMHQDLVLSHKMASDQQKKKEARTFKEEEQDKFKRLSHEYDIIHDSQNAERYI